MMSSINGWQTCFAFGAAIYFIWFFFSLFHKRVKKNLVTTDTKEDTLFSLDHFTFSFLISCNSNTSAETFCECRSTPGLISTSQLSIGFGLPPSLTQANVSSEFSLTGTKMLPASKRLESINKYGAFGRSAGKTFFFVLMTR